MQIHSVVDVPLMERCRDDADVLDKEWEVRDHARDEHCDSD